MTLRIVRYRWEEIKAKAQAAAGAVDGLQRAGELGQARADTDVPVDTGRLMDSAKVTIRKDEFAAYISYNTPYAIVQHQDLSLTHERGRAKWLQRAIEDNARALIALLVVALRRRLG